MLLKILALRISNCIQDLKGMPESTTVNSSQSCKLSQIRGKQSRYMEKSANPYKLVATWLAEWYLMCCVCVNIKAYHTPHAHIRYSNSTLFVIVFDFDLFGIFPFSYSTIHTHITRMILPKFHLIDCHCTCSNIISNIIMCWKAQDLTRGISLQKMKLRMLPGASHQQSTPLTWQCTCKPSLCHSANTSSRRSLLYHPDTCTRSNAKFQKDFITCPDVPLGYASVCFLMMS